MQTENSSLLLNMLPTIKKLKVSLSVNAVLFSHIIQVSGVPLHTWD